MEEITARISQRGKVIADGVKVYLQPESGGGSFHPPPGAFFMPGNYRLDATDGRGAAIEVLMMHTDTENRMRVAFSFTGAFK